MSSHDSPPGPLLDPNCSDAEAANRGCLAMETPSWVPPSITSAGLLQKIGAELISTYILVFAGCGAAMVDVKRDGAITHLGVSAAFGIVVMIMIYSVGHISGAHMNPAVTIAFATVRHFPWAHVPAYIGAQVVAAISAGFSLRLILGSVAKMGATLPVGSDVQSLALEIITSYILMFVVSAVATDTRAIGELAGLAVGSTVGLDAIFAGPISGASMNPARSIGPAVASYDFTSLWVYVVGPVVGCLLGAWSYTMIRLPEQPQDLAVIRQSKSFKSSRHG